MLLIRRARKELGLSQGDVAVLAGTRQATISDIETGRQRPGDELLGRIAVVLGVDPPFALLRPVAEGEVPPCD